MYLNLCRELYYILPFYFYKLSLFFLPTETLVISRDIPVRFVNWRVSLFVLSPEFQTLIKVIFASASVLTAERDDKGTKRRAYAISK